MFMASLKVIWDSVVSSEVGIFLRSGYFLPEGVVSRATPKEDTQYKLYFADMIHKSNHNGFIHKTVCSGNIKRT